VRCARRHGRRRAFFLRGPSTGRRGTNRLIDRNRRFVESTKDPSNEKAASSKSAKRGEGSADPTQRIATFLFSPSTQNATLGSYSALLTIAVAASVSLLSLASLRTQVDTTRRQAERQDYILAGQLRNSARNIAQAEALRPFGGAASDFTTPYEGGTMAVTYRRPHADTLQFTARGTFRSASRAVSETWVRTETRLNAPAAVYLRAVSVNPTWTGNAFGITGSPQATAVLVEAASGKASNSRDLRDRMIDALRFNQEDNVSGTQSRADIRVGTGFDLDRLLRAVEKQPAQTYGPTEDAEGDEESEDGPRGKGKGKTKSKNGGDTLNGNVLLGSPSDPGVFRFTDGLRLSGTLVGHGILIVEGDFMVGRGTAEWNGLVLVQPPGDATVDLSGTVDINGQLVVDTPGTLQYEMAGNGPITYRESGSGAVTTTTIQRHRTRHH
jgi:hypothetical protein